MIKVNCIATIEKPRAMLYVGGLWPLRKITIYEVLKFTFSLLSCIFLFIFAPYNTANAIKSNDMKLLNLMICVLIPSVNYVAKGYTIMRNKTCLQAILQDLESEAFSKHSDQLNRYIQRIDSISNLLLKYFIFTLTLYVSVRSVLPIIMNVSIIIPPPFDMGKYDLLYRIVHFFVTANVSFNTIAFDVFYLTLMGLCVAQLNILEERLQNVFEEVENPCNTEVNSSLRATNILKECVILHETINQYVQKLNVLLSFPLFVQYTCGCFILCNTILQISTLETFNSTSVLGVCTYFSITFGQMATFHYIGNEIIFKSDKIIELSYTSKWYKLSVVSQKMLFTLMERAKRPLVIQIYKYIPISLESLGVIFRWAYSVFALMRARYH